jgi:hypothetical protein
VFLALFGVPMIAWCDEKKVSQSAVAATANGTVGGHIETAIENGEL